MAGLSIEGLTGCGEGMSFRICIQIGGIPIILSAGDRGFSVPQIVGRVFLTNLALAGLALLTVARHDAVVAAAALAIGAALVAWLILGFARGRR